MANWTAPFKWGNSGAEPSENLKQTGFLAGYQPPVDTFNYFLHNHSKYIEELQKAYDDLNVGKSMAGQTVKPTYNTTVTAGKGAEIFNDYRERTYGGSFNAFAETGNVASGAYSHAEGKITTASGEYSHAQNYDAVASGFASHAQNIGTTASGAYSHSEGSVTTASGEASHAEGASTRATKKASHAQNHSSTASGNYSHAQNFNTTASGEASHAQGNNTIASGDYSAAYGGYSEAKGTCSLAVGYGIIAHDYQTVFGLFNREDTTTPIHVTSETETYPEDFFDQTIFMVGVGNQIPDGDTTRINAMRILQSGRCYGSGAFLASGADYAEYFEWLDGNPDDEDRRGLIVTLDGNKIRPANQDDNYILGVISATPVITGGTYADTWQGMYLKDPFGDILYTDNNVPVLNPEYNPEQEYVSREYRPEWDAVGTHGQLVVIDDGTCQINGYCTVSTNGIGTASDTKTRFRVMERLDDTHIRIYVRNRC